MNSYFRMIRRALLSWIILGIYFTTVTKEECFDNNNGIQNLLAQRLDSFRLVDGLHHLSTVKATRVGCLRACFLDLSCKGFNFARSSKTCELKSVADPLSSELTAIDDFEFYGLVSCANEDVITSTVSATTESITTEGPTTECSTEQVTTVGQVVTTATPLLEPPIIGPPNMQTTVIMFYVLNEQGLDVFIRGGRKQIYSDCLTSCTSNCATNDPCSVDITHISPGTGGKWDRYNTWMTEDLRLDHFGHEDLQGKIGGTEPAEGTPLALTSNNVFDNYYHIYNQWGPDYWMFQGPMDCSQTEDGWIYFKGVKTIGPPPHAVYFEDAVVPDSTCTGNVGGTIPSTATDGHYARCGYLNKLSWGSPSCKVDFLD